MRSAVPPIAPPISKPVAKPIAKPIAPPAQAFVPPPREPVIDERTPEERAIAHEAQVAAEAEAVAHIVEDDDTLNMPAPAPEALAHRPLPPRPRGELLSRTVAFKQTLIPVLLTMGVLLSAIATWSFMLGEESPLASSAWITISLFVIGVVMLLFAVLTMFQVRHQLARPTPT